MTLAGDPMAIHQQLLDETGKALMQGDFAAFARCFALPHRAETFAGAADIRTEEDLRRVFEGVRGFLLRNGVTEFVRNCVSAQFVAPDEIHASHQSRMAARGQLVHRGHPAFSVLRHDGSRWRVADSQYAIGDAPDLAQAITGRPAMPRETAPQTTKHHSQ